MLKYVCCVYCALFSPSNNIRLSTYDRFKIPCSYCPFPPLRHGGPDHEVVRDHRNNESIICLYFSNCTGYLNRQNRRRSSPPHPSKCALSLFLSSTVYRFHPALIRACSLFSSGLSENTQTTKWSEEQSCTNILLELLQSFCGRIKQRKNLFVPYYTFVFPICDRRHRFLVFQ